MTTRFYTTNQVKNRLGLWNDKDLHEAIVSEQIPKPVRHNRFDADKIDRIYWELYHQRALPMTPAPDSALHPERAAKLTDER